MILTSRTLVSRDNYTSVQLMFVLQEDYTIRVSDYDGNPVTLIFKQDPKDINRFYCSENIAHLIVGNPGLSDFNKKRHLRLI